MGYEEKYDPKKDEQDRNEKVEAFKILNEFGMSEFYIDLMLNELKNRLNLIDLLLVVDKPSKDYQPYSKYKEEYKEFFTKNQIIDLKGFMAEKHGLTKEKVIEDFKGKGKPADSDIYSYVIDKLKDDSGNVEDLSEAFILGGPLEFRVRNTINMAQVVLKKSKEINPNNEEDLQTLRFNYFYVYVMLFECLIGLYKPIYKKFSGINRIKDIRVKDMLKFFNEKYSFLTTNLDYDLRNDASHILFIKRSEYDNEKLRNISVELILQLIAFFYSMIEVYVKIIEDAVKIRESYNKEDKSNKE